MNIARTVQPVDWYSLASTVLNCLWRRKPSRSGSLGAGKDANPMTFRQPCVSLYLALARADAATWPFRVAAARATLEGARPNGPPRARRHRPQLAATCATPPRCRSTATRPNSWSPEPSERQVNALAARQPAGGHGSPEPATKAAHRRTSARDRREPLSASLAETCLLLDGRHRPVVGAQMARVKPGSIHDRKLSTQEHRRRRKRSARSTPSHQPAAASEEADNSARSRAVPFAPTRQTPSATCRSALDVRRPSAHRSGRRQRRRFPPAGFQ